MKQPFELIKPAHKIYFNHTAMSTVSTDFFHVLNSLAPGCASRASGGEKVFFLKLIGGHGGQQGERKCS
jgi:hypothetical protein